jgi:hypothetical protein
MAESSFEQICERMEVPEALRKHIAPGAPNKGKIAVAKGLLPAPPRVLLAMQYMLLGDSDPTVAKEAEGGILGLPEDRLAGLLDRRTHPKILEFVVYRRSADKRLMEQIVLLHQLNDKSICFLAENGRGRVVEMVAGNQERLITTPQIFRFLERNPDATPALLDRVRSFHRLYGIDLPKVDVLRAQAEAQRKEQDEIAEAAAAAEAASKRGAAPTPEPAPTSSPPPGMSGPAGPPSGPPIDWQPAPPGPDGLPADFVPGDVYIPPPPQAPYSPPPGLINPLAGLMADWGIPDRADFVAPPEGPIHQASAGLVAEQAPLVVEQVDTSKLTEAGSVELGSVAAESAEEVDISGMSSLAGSDFAFDFNEEESEFGNDFVDEEAGEDDSIKEAINKQIQKMTVGQKIKLAYKGNKAVREILVRDANKIVGVAVIKSGRITDREVMSIATNRSINEDVIRALCTDREFLRKYPVKVALASNPKTPIPTAIGLLNSLHVRDLKKVATNRNVASAVFTAASKLYKARKTSMR